MSLCHLRLAVACDSGLTYFRRNTISSSPRVLLFDATLYFEIFEVVLFVNVHDSGKFSLLLSYLVTI